MTEPHITEAGSHERVWSDTQQWLDELEQDLPHDTLDEAGAPAEDADDDVAVGSQPTDEADSADCGGSDGADGEQPPVDLDEPAGESSGVDDEPPDDIDLGGEEQQPAGAVPESREISGISAVHVSAVTAEAESESSPPRFNKAIAAGFVIATVAATTLVSGALLVMRSGARPHTAEQPAGPTTAVSVAAAPTTTGPADTAQDAPLPYTATAHGCLPGSSAAQAVASPDTTQAWVCVTGGNVGQYLTLELGRTMVITAVCITPGWVGTDTSGVDQWQQHRVATRVQWSFNDTPPTVVAQDTHNVHGETCQPMPKHGDEQGVLASQITVLVQETSRAPADVATSSAPAPPPDGLFGEVLGPPPTSLAPAPSGTADPVLPGLPGEQSHSEPVDNTFAVSSIQVFGHSPLH